jgi:hypothetical protein
MISLDLDCDFLNLSSFVMVDWWFKLVGGLGSWTNASSFLGSFLRHAAEKLLSV